MKTRQFTGLIAVLALVAWTHIAPIGAAGQADKDAKAVADAITAFKQSDKLLPKWFDSSYG